MGIVRPRKGGNNMSVAWGDANWSAVAAALDRAADRCADTERWARLVDEVGANAGAGPLGSAGGALSTAFLRVLREEADAVGAPLERVVAVLVTGVTTPYGASKAGAFDETVRLAMAVEGYYGDVLPDLCRIGAAIARWTEVSVRRVAGSSNAP
jgi:hypothetical protein